MRYVFGSGKSRDVRRRGAQTLVFFLLAWGTIMLLCGLAIDSGLLYLAKARLARAVDGAALAAVGNFNQNSNASVNRDDVAQTMRNFAVANFTDLASIGTSGGPPGGSSSDYTASNGQKGTEYTYTFTDGISDGHNYVRFVQVTLQTGSGGNITSATCNARCPVQTYFIGYATYAIGGRQNVKIGGYSGPSSLVDLKVSSGAVASRNPRLIMVVLDRSASMLQPGGGAFGLPQAVVQFLDFFDTSSDYIGIVSFGTSARLEMPLTTNFIYAATNVLFDSYAIATTASGTNGVPGPDPEEFTSNADYDSGYATTGVRRMKFGGQTCADEGIRLAMEQLMENPGFNDPDVVKYMVIFTDGKWNEMRTLLAAPGYTNTVIGPPVISATNKWLTNTGTWNVNLAKDTNLVPVPTMSPVPYVTNAMAGPNVFNFTPYADQHTNDAWQSVDTSDFEPLLNPSASSSFEGIPTNFQGTTFLFTTSTVPPTNFYAHNIDVWLQPGAVDYVYRSNNITGLPSQTYVSTNTAPNGHINITLNTDDTNVLVVPGYVVDGCVYDGLDLPYADNPAYGGSGFPAYRADNYQEPFMWPDDTEKLNTAAKINNFTTNASLERQLMFRNYPNLLTGFYVNRPDDPPSTETEPLDDTTPATLRPLNGLGPYYPSAGFYWPFDLVGVDYDPTYALTNAIEDPDLSGQGLSRHAAYSINMLSSAATPEWSGEWFYESSSGAGTNVTSGTSSTPISSLMATKAQWEAGAPSWLLNDFDNSGEDIMTNEPAHNTNLAVSVWRPLTFSGTLVASNIVFTEGPRDLANATGGYVTDGHGNYYRNAMAWSGRPTHYFDFSKAKWMPIPNNHDKNTLFLPLGSWKAQEYAWHARAQGVTIYTVGYGQLVYPSQQVLLAQIANATNTTAGNPQVFTGTAVTSYTPGPGTAIPFNPSQPIGEEFYATNSTDISNDFFQVGQAINAALTQ